MLFVWFCEILRGFQHLPAQEPLVVQESNTHQGSVQPAISRQCLRLAQAEGQFCCWSSSHGVHGTVVLSQKSFWRPLVKDMYL